ncbi:MAG TPA: XRE family transcriptional regulator [Parachlamydiales bacterium]|nr:XRE family transcriptional regulator [Parachlamydiales bacterium]
MNYSVQALAAKLKAAREKKGLSQRALGAKVGIAQSHISKLEQGLIDLQLSTFIDIARALELEPVLVSREHLTTVEAVQKLSKGTKQTPAYQLDEEDEEN